MKTQGDVRPSDREEDAASLESLKAGLPVWSAALCVSSVLVLSPNSWIDDLPAISLSRSDLAAGRWVDLLGYAVPREQPAAAVLQLFFVIMLLEYARTRRHALPAFLWVIGAAILIVVAGGLLFLLGGGAPPLRSGWPVALGFACLYLVVERRLVAGEFSDLFRGLAGGDPESPTLLWRRVTPVALAAVLSVLVLVSALQLPVLKAALAGLELGLSTALSLAVGLGLAHLSGWVAFHRPAIVWPLGLALITTTFLADASPAVWLACVGCLATALAIGLSVPVVVASSETLRAPASQEASQNALADGGRGAVTAGEGMKMLRRAWPECLLALLLIVGGLLQVLGLFTSPFGVSDPFGLMASRQALVEGRWWTPLTSLFLVHNPLEWVFQGWIVVFLLVAALQRKEPRPRVEILFWWVVVLVAGGVGRLAVIGLSSDKPTLAGLTPVFAGLVGWGLSGLRRGGENSLDGQQAARPGLVATGWGTRLGWGIVAAILILRFVERIDLDRLDLLPGPDGPRNLIIFCAVAAGLAAGAVNIALPRLTFVSWGALLSLCSLAFVLSASLTGDVLFGVTAGWVLGRLGGVRHS